MPITVLEATQAGDTTVRLRTSALDLGTEYDVTVSDVKGTNGLVVNPSFDLQSASVSTVEEHPVFSTNLVGFWQLDGDACDAGPNGLDGTLTGSPSTVSGKVTTALSFNGSSQYATILHDAAFNQAQLTIAFWVKPTALTSSQTILSKGGTPTSDDAVHFQFLVGTYYDSRYIFEIKNSAGNYIQVIGGPAVADTWAHVIGVIHSSYIAIYHNGELAGIAPLVGTVAYNTSDLTVGKRSGTSPAYFNGVVDEVAIWNVAHSLHTVDFLYHYGSGVVYSTTAPRVSSAVAVDAYTVRVVFDKYMRNNNDLVLPANYQFDGPFTLTASEVERIDATTVEITIAEEMETDGEYTVEVSSVKSSTGIVIDSVFDTAGFYGLGITPKLLSTLYVDDYHFDITFNEAMQDNAALRNPSNYVVTGSGAPTVSAVAPISGTVVRATCSLIGDDIYLLTVSNVTDIRDNIINPDFDEADLCKDMVGPYLESALFAALEHDSVLAHPTLSTGLVSFWPLGHATTDVHTNKLGGYYNANGVSPFAGKHGMYAAKFNGSNQAFTVSDNALLNTANWSVGFWVYLTSSQTNYPAMVCKTQFGPERTLYRFAYDYNYERIYLIHNNTASATMCIYGETQVKIGTWYYVTGTFDGTVMKLYIDGILQSSMLFTGTVQANSGTLQIGGRPSNNDCWFNGAIQDVGIWSKALTQAEVTALYNNGNGLPYYNKAEGDSFALTFNETIKDTASITEISNYDYQNADTVMDHPTLPSGLVAFYEMSGDLRDSHIGKKHGELSGYVTTYFGQGHQKNTIMFYNESSNEGRGMILSDADLETDACSISFWMCPWVSDGSWRSIISKSVDPGGDGGPDDTVQWQFFKNSSNQIYFSFRQTDGTEYAATDSAFSVGTWYHYVGTCDPGRKLITLYRNGLPVAYAAYAGTRNINNYPIMISGKYTVATPPWSINNYKQNNYMFMENLGIWNRALTAQEVLDLWNGGNGRNYNVGSITSVSKTDTDQITLVQNAVERVR